MTHYLNMKVCFIQTYYSSAKRTWTINCFQKCNVHEFSFYTPYDNLLLQKHKLYAERIYKKISYTFCRHMSSCSKSVFEDIFFNLLTGCCRDAMIFGSSWYTWAALKGSSTKIYNWESSSMSSKYP